MSELKNKALRLCLTKDDLLMEAELLENFGEYLHISFIGYTSEQLRAVANELPN